MTDRAAQRLHRLQSHLTSDSSFDHPYIASNLTSTSTDSPHLWHKQCYNFDPGQLLLNQVAIITGAGAGIGRATAILFASHGAYVTVSDIDAAAAEATASFIRNSSGPDRCIVVPGDVMSENFPATVVSKTVEAFGGLHILVPNAGFTWDTVIQNMNKKQWDTIISVHMTSVFRLVQAAVPHMREAAKKELKSCGKARPRSVITLASVSGVHGMAGQTNYAAAKAGVIGFTKALAKEWGHFNIRCNAVAPGFIVTRLTQNRDKGAFVEVEGQKVALGVPKSDESFELRKKMTPLGRDGQPEEVAGAILMLACPYSSYVTGQVLEVEGGMYM